MQIRTALALLLCMSLSAVICGPYNGLSIPSECRDNPYFASCSLIVRSKFCNHLYYSQFCCNSCSVAGQLDPIDTLRHTESDGWR